jgi:GcrA cell cycle regulator
MLEKLLAEGRLSFPEIARAINKQFGTSYTRRAVASRARRKGLISQKPKRAEFKVIHGIKQRQKLAENPGIDPEPFVCKDAPDVVPLNKTMLELREGERRYVYGNEPAKMVFCGHPIHWRMIGGEMRPSSYCEAHFLICTQAPRKPTKPEFVELGKSRGGAFGSAA